MPAGLSASEAVNSVDGLTARAQSCQGPANQINIVNIALAVSGVGPIPVVITRLVDIVKTTADVISQIDPSTSYTAKADQDALSQCISTFVEVNQSLLNILIGKSGLVPNLIPFVGPPVAATLRQLESVYDTMLFELIDCCPDVSEKANNLKDSLDNTLEECIKAWAGSS